MGSWQTWRQQALICKAPPDGTPVHPKATHGVALPALQKHAAEYYIQ